MQVDEVQKIAPYKLCKLIWYKELYPTNTHYLLVYYTILTMDKNYSKLLEKLKNLKLRYAATGLKLELETEIISTAEIDLAQKLAKESGLCLTLKTSGCSAVSDIFLSKALGISNILSPMIESAYALEKFYENVKDIHADLPSSDRLCFSYVS